MAVSTKALAWALAVSTGVGALAIWGQNQQPQASQEKQVRAPYPAPAVSNDEFDRWMKEKSNWGRWGKDDQLGTLNLITAAKRKQAISLAKEGTMISLEHTDLLGPKSVDNPTPFVRVLPKGAGGNLDRFESMNYHGFYFTHFDALCHIVYKDQLYNGIPASIVTSEAGCPKLGMEHVQNGIVTRGVLIDIPRLKGVPYLEPGTPIYPEDIEAWEKKAGVKVGSGDAILVYTGRWKARAKLGPFRNLAGFHMNVAPWLKSRDVAVLCDDGVHDVGVGTPIPGIGFPIHTFAIAGLGAYLVDNADLEVLAETAARLRRWEFMLTVAPMVMETSTGAPVNPIATF